MAKFRLMYGLYIPGKDDEGNRIVHRPGAVVESEHDLAAKHGEKFRLVDGSPMSSRAKQPGEKATIKLEDGTVVTGVVQDYVEQPAPPPAQPTSSREDLETMTVSDLRRYAEKEEIDLEGVRSKQEIIDKILAAQEGQEEEYRVAPNADTY